MQPGVVGLRVIEGFRVSGGLVSGFRCSKGFRVLGLRFKEFCA